VLQFVRFLRIQFMLPSLWLPKELKRVAKYKYIIRVYYLPTDALYISLRKH